MQISDISAWIHSANSNASQGCRSQSHNDENLPTTRKALKLHRPSHSTLQALPLNSSDLLPSICTHFLSPENEKVTGHCLDLHLISPNVRVKMVDWMIEVISAFHKSLDTFFLAVKVMDYFLSKSSTRYSDEQVHLIGITCMLIVSKFEEVQPFSMKVMVDTVGKRKFTAQDIFAMELTVLEATHFELHLVTPINVLEYICEALPLPQTLKRTAEIALVINQMSMQVQAATPSAQAVASLTLACIGLNRMEILPLILPFAQGKETQRLAAHMKANVALYCRDNEQSALPKYLSFRVHRGLPFEVV